MAVKRERPDQGIPGQLHTPDGRKLSIRLPGEPDPPATETTDREPEPARRSEPAADDEA